MEENSEIKTLFDAGAHIGYSKTRRHPKMHTYIFGTRNNVEIFDLDKTLKQLKEAEEFMRLLGRNGKIPLFVGTKPAAARNIEKIGERLNLPYVNKRWLGGTITNFKVIGGRLSYVDKLENDERDGGFSKFLKKEKFVKEAELKKLQLTFKGIRHLKGMPDALFIVDTGEEAAALREAIKKKVPVVGLLNTDCNPSSIEYMIPANDNSAATIAVILDRIAFAYEEGVKEKKSI